MRIWILWQNRITWGDQGASMVEYAFLIGLIAIVVLAGALFLGGTLETQFNDVGSSVEHY